MRYKLEVKVTTYDFRTRSEHKVVDWIDIPDDETITASSVRIESENGLVIMGD